MRCLRMRAVTCSASRRPPVFRFMWCPPARTGTTRSCCTTRTTRDGRPSPFRAESKTQTPSGAYMLTEDGKHLYVSYDEYHNLIEKLALKVYQSGWEFDTILCLARGGMRPGD